MHKEKLSIYEVDAQCKEKGLYLTEGKIGSKLFLVRDEGERKGLLRKYREIENTLDAIVKIRKILTSENEEGNRNKSIIKLIE